VKYLSRGNGYTFFFTDEEAVGEYDPSKILVIDPTIVYSTYLGGSQIDVGFGIAVGSKGQCFDCDASCGKQAFCLSRLCSL
jgi:hypothetical protein